MVTEMDVLERLREKIVEGLSREFDGFRDDSAIIDFPDTDSMRRNLMVYIQPDYEALEDLSVGTDLARMNASVFILAKGAPNAELIKTVFRAYTSLYLMLRGDPTLGGFISETRITDMDYYPAVTASRTVVAIEAQTEMQWAKGFMED